MKRSCEYCGKPFDPYEVDAEGRTNYCSDACRGADTDSDQAWNDLSNAIETAQTTNGAEGLKGTGASETSSSVVAAPRAEEAESLPLSVRIAAMPGYLNGYDPKTEADMHHAYKVGFIDARRSALPVCVEGATTDEEKVTRQSPASLSGGQDLRDSDGKGSER